jgi:hypothetical protein
MASTSLTKLYEHGQRAREALKNLRQREKTATNDMVRRAGEAGATIVGLLAAGTIDGKWGHDNTQAFGGAREEKHGIALLGPVPINSGIGLIAIAVGIPGALPGSEYLTQFGAAMFGYPIAKMIEDRLANPDAAKTP